MRRPRRFAPFGLCALATALASIDNRTGWTATVGVVTFLLAIWALVTMPEDPEAEAKEAAKHQARVDRILERYERERASRTDGDAERDA